MPREKSITCREDRVATSSFNIDADDHEPLGVDQE
jgi:hypothetical protein